MSEPKTLEAIEAMNESQPDWAVRAAEEIRLEHIRQNSVNLHAHTIAAILRANSPDVGKLREALDGLKAACVDVLIPSINEAIKGGFKMETWTAEQMQFAQAVKDTDDAIASVPQLTETVNQRLLKAAKAMADFCINNPEKIRDIADDVWIQFEDAIEAAESIALPTTASSPKD